MVLASEGYYEDQMSEAGVNAVPGPGQTQQREAGCHYDVIMLPDAGGRK